eukprot:88611-Amphidinium_carterae.1
MLKLSKKLKLVCTGMQVDGRTICRPMTKASTSLTCGYSTDVGRAPELNRELCVEILGAVAALGKSDANRM